MMFEKASSKMYKILYFEMCFLVYIEFVSGTQPLMPNLDLLNMKPRIENLNKIPLKGKPVPPCIACQSLVKSFLAAVKKTTRQSFSGGDADWEKQKLGAYENSELRFIEIQEMLCADIDLGKDQCYNLAEEYEPELEEWFHKKRKKDVDLLKSLCIDHIKVCCPNNTYGPNCIPCPGGIENPCGGRGKCRKGGTREEPANCVCDSGYGGELCTECGKGYYPEIDSPVLKCIKCDVACKGHCRGPGPNNCEVCAVGYHFTPNKGCIAQSQIPETDDTLKDSSDEEKNSKEKLRNLSSSVVSSREEDNIQINTNVDDSTAETTHLEL